MQTRDDNIIEQLVLELMKKVDSYHEFINNKLDNKVDSLEIRMCEEIRLLRKESADKQDILRSDLKKLDDRN